MSCLISTEEVAGIYLCSDIIEDGIVAIGDDGLGKGLELGEVINDTAAEEGGAVFEGGLVDDDLGSLGLDAFHHALNA